MNDIDTYLEVEEFEDHYCRVPKYALSDKNLSLKAKGLYAYLASMPKNWKLYRTQMLDHLSDGKDSLNSAFKELEKFGYLISTPIRSQGQFKGYKLKLLIKSLFNTDEIQPLRKNRRGKTVSEKSATNKIDNNNLLLLDNVYVGSLFIKEFNKIKNSDFRLTQNLRERFDKVFLEYNYKDVLKALENAMKEKYHIENGFNDLTPEFITRADKLEKYLNYKTNNKNSQPVTLNW